jgi:hypothetical protein
LVAIHICGHRNRDNDKEKTTLLRQAYLLQHMKDVTHLMVLIEKKLAAKAARH